MKEVLIQCMGLKTITVVSEEEYTLTQFYFEGTGLDIVRASVVNNQTDKSYHRVLLLDELADTHIIDTLDRTVTWRLGPIAVDNLRIKIVYYEEDGERKKIGYITKIK